MCHEAQKFLHNIKIMMVITGKILVRKKVTEISEI